MLHKNRLGVIVLKLGLERLSYINKGAKLIKDVSTQQLQQVVYLEFGPPGRK